MARSYLLVTAALLSCTGKTETSVVRLNPDIVIAPEAVDFGSVLRLYSVTKEVQILNAGSGSLDILDAQIKVAPRYEGNFEISSVDDLDKIPAGGSGVLELTFTPEDYVPYEAELWIDSNDDDQPTVAVEITGLGAEGSTPDIAVSQR